MRNLKGIHMKKLIAVLTLVLATSAYADHPYRHGYYHSGSGGWVAPLIIGGAMGYMIARPPVVVQQPPVVVANPPVVVQQPPVMVQSNDVVYIDGIAYRKQVMLMNGVYQEVLVRM